jgi:ADP-heptose:LPS heptosyltransferase
MHLLVIRTSSMGDVALTAPVLASVIRQYPDVRITLLTRPAFVPVFHGMEGFGIISADFSNRHKGPAGIVRLFRELKKSDRIDHIIDLHDVIRTKILRWLFRLSGVRASVIDKGRAEKKALISGKKKTQLKHTVERYFDVFATAGFPAAQAGGPFLNISACPAAHTVISGEILNIGVAPFSRHTLKIWPEEYMVRLLTMISGKHNVRYLLFGGMEDKIKLGILSGKVPGSEIIAGRYSIPEELAIMSRLDLMITMDSANMHMAALTGTRVVSIWGCTDPLAGFGAWQQPDEYSIRIPVNELTCRPCTIYGKGKTHNGFKCMKMLKPEMVYEKLISLKLL